MSKQPNPYYDEGDAEANASAENDFLSTDPVVPLEPSISEVKIPAKPTPVIPQRPAVKEEPVPLPLPEQTLPMPTPVPQPKPVAQRPKVSPAPVAPEGYREIERPAPQEYKREEEAYIPPVRTYEEAPPIIPEPISTNKKDKRSKVKSLTKGSGLSKIDMYEGGRWKILIFRWAIWAVLGLIVLGGVKSIVFPNKVNTATLGQTIGAQLGFNGFPVLSGEDFARSFARDYLTFTANDSGNRSSTLAHYLPGQSSQESWTNPATGAIAQSVVRGPFLLNAPTLFGADTTRAIYNFTAEVRNAKGQDVWLYLAVTVYNEKGALAISGPPGFFATPPSVAGDGAFVYPVSKTATDSFSTDLPDFFKSWASSDSVNLPRYLQANATDAVKNGMKGAVTYVSFSGLKVSDVGSKKDAAIYGPRYSEVYITWQANGNLWVQGYRMTVVHASDGKWYVQDISPGDFGAVAH